MTKEPKLQVNINNPLFVRNCIIDHGHRIFSFSLLICCFFSQGARRIVSEWPDLDSEARQFTAKILGDEVERQETTASPIQSDTSKSDASSKESAPSHTSTSDVSSEGDSESKAEL